MRLVELIDVNGIDLAQPIWSRDCATYAQKWPKNTKNAFFACFFFSLPMLDSLMTV